MTISNKLDAIESAVDDVVNLLDQLVLIASLIADNAVDLQRRFGASAADDLANGNTARTIELLGYTVRTLEKAMSTECASALLETQKIREIAEARS